MYNTANNALTATSNRIEVSLDAVLSASPAIVNRGETITVTYSGSLGNYQDWIGLYRLGTADPLDYESCNEELYTKSGSVTFTAPLNSGLYEFRMYNTANNLLVATSGQVEVKLEGTVSASPSTVRPGEVITVTYSGSLGNYQDWIGLYRLGTTDPLDYESCNEELYTKSGAKTFTAPQTTGQYEFRMYTAANNTFVAKSDPVNVRQPMNTTVTAAPTTLYPGDKITVTYSGAPGNKYDSIAMYQAGTLSNADPIAEIYLKKKKSGKLTFTAPEEAGLYEFRMFEQDQDSEIGTSNAVTVTAVAALEITQSNPEDGAEGVPLTTKEITVTFNEPIKKGEDIKKITLTCEDEEITYKTSASVKKNVLTVKWKGKLIEGADYTLCIPANAVTDARTKKRSLAGDEEITFTTALE